MQGLVVGQRKPTISFKGSRDRAANSRIIPLADYVPVLGEALVMTKMARTPLLLKT